MSSFYYKVHLEECAPSVVLHSLEETFAFLKNAGLVTILRYNDNETGVFFAELANEYCLSAKDQKDRPVFISTALSYDGVFVESEEFWIKNYMLDEFYNPEQIPYIEEISENK